MTHTAAICPGAASVTSGITSRAGPVAVITEVPLHRLDHGVLGGLAVDLRLHGRRHLAAGERFGFVRGDFHRVRADGGLLALVVGAELPGALTSGGGLLVGLRVGQWSSFH
jgi:hypothetical protein